jgi:hypothetical protein
MLFRFTTRRELVARVPGTTDSRRSARRNAVWLCAVGFGVMSCSLPAGEEESATDPPPLGTVAQALDSDSDGLDDAWETTNFGNLAQTAAGDPDADDMTNLEEFQNTLNPNVNDAFDDADGDRYPNIFELRNGGAVKNAAVTPASTYTVNVAGGGTHTTIGAAVAAATVANGAYQIIGIAPGTYTGSSNYNITIDSSKPKLLFIGLQGAGKTIIDGGLGYYGWQIQRSLVVASLTFQKTWSALYFNAAGQEGRFVDLIVRDNAEPNGNFTAGLNVGSSGRVVLTGSTFFNNTGLTGAHQVNIGSGTALIANTVVWSTGGTGTNLYTAAGTTVTINNSLVKGQTLTGTGNLAGTTNPKLRADLKLLWDSPLRGAGGTSKQSRIDIDGELRPASTPDIGVDQFIDTDADGLPDAWEISEAGNLTALTSRTQDSDADSLNNELEYANATKPTVADTDGDGVSDGSEVNTYGTNPRSVDTDGDDMPDGWEVTYGLSATTANGYDDADGDRYPNVFEYARGTNPASLASIPTANYTVDVAGGGTHTTIGAAVTTANVANGAYQIIGIAPGTYTGSSNYNITIDPSKPKLLFIGLQGAGKTVVAGDLTYYGWQIQRSVVVSSLTFQNTWSALYFNASGQEGRFIDLIVRDNVEPNGNYTAGLNVGASARVVVTGSTFFNNSGLPGAHQINIGSGTALIANTVVWSTAGTGTNLGSAGGTTVTTNNCLVKGQTLTGTGNLAGTTNPKFRSDLRLLWDSPLRGAGGTVAQSRIDIDGETRPATAPDIGVDQFNDSDADGLADKWELDEAGNLTTLTGRTQDSDADGLNNELEYANFAKPLVADSDGDGVSDGVEVNTYGSNPRNVDTDGDDMPDGWEVMYGISPTIANGYDDGDGDRYPNVFEYARGTNPSSFASVPTANYTVNVAGGGSHTTIGAAVATANVANGAYQIIGIAPGTYTGSSNYNVTVDPSKPKLLFIGLQGAGKTIVEGDRTYYGWQIQRSVVVASLTFQKTFSALYFNAAGQEARFVDLMVRDNTEPGGNFSAGLNVGASGRVVVTGSAFINNAGPTGARQINIGSGVATIANTVVWSAAGSGTNVGISGGATVTVNNSLVKGQTFAGSGNLAGSTDPKFRSDLHLRSDSPLRGAGGTIAQSRVDIDGELRPVSAPDIGVDQFVDADADGLPDAWEVANYGNTTALSGTADPDSDGLSNATELDLETNMLDPDTDKDRVRDGVEVTIGTNPLVADADDLTGARA